MSVILPCTCKDDIIIICNNKKAITEHDPFNKITAQIFIFNWSKTGLKWPPQSRPHTKNTSIFKVLFAYHPCTGKCCRGNLPSSHIPGAGSPPLMTPHPMDLEHGACRPSVVRRHRDSSAWYCPRSVDGVGGVRCNRRWLRSWTRPELRLDKKMGWQGLWRICSTGKIPGTGWIILNR